jgi:peptidyl-prolyl cis-trans isomerase D
MLQVIRDRASGWIAYIIVILISIPFALWGIQEYLGGSDSRLAAEVNGNEIPLRAFNREYHQQRQYLQSIMGGQLPPQYSEPALKQSVINKMVRNELLRQEVEDSGYDVGNRVLLKEISAIPAFLKDGKFDSVRYEHLLQAQGRSKTEFEQSLRQQIRVAHFVDGVRQSAFLPNQTLADYRRLKNQERKVSYFLIAAASDKAAQSITEEEIKNYYQTNQHSFRTSERVKLAYVELKEQALTEGIEVDEETLHKVYHDQADRYVNPEQRRARQIFLKFPSSSELVDEKLINETRAKADKIVAKLRQGEDFADLAKRYSQDSLSASSGGDLGFIAKGDMDSQFEDVLFSLEINKISDPVKTQQGFHIIQLMAIKPAEQKSFESVRERVEEEYKQRAAESRFVEMTEQLLTLSYERPDSLEPVLDSLGLPIRETDWITQDSGEGIGAFREVRTAAFSDDVLRQGKNSDLVELADGTALVLRILEHNAAKTKPLADVKDEIKNLIAASKAREQARNDGRKALEQLRSGETPEAVAEQFDSQLATPGFVRRDNTQIPRVIIHKVFTLNKPQPEEKVTGGVQLSSGDYAVILLDAVKEPIPKQDNQKSVDAQQFLAYGAREVEAALQVLRDAAEIRILRENI